MRLISPLGGRLVLAAICALSLAALIPAVAFGETTSITSPFPATLSNPCVPEVVTFDATVTVTQQEQTDGTLRTYLRYGGSGVGFPSGAVYSFSQETHIWLGGPGQADDETYDYQKIIRRSETAGALGGDDYYMRVAFKTVDGMPVLDPRNTGIECR